MTDKETPFIKKEVALLKCLKCGHEWMPRFKDNIPVACPLCKRKSWKIPAGQRKKYDWKDPVHKAWIGRKDWKQRPQVTNITESNKRTVGYVLQDPQNITQRVTYMKEGNTVKVTYEK